MVLLITPRAYILQGVYFLQKNDVMYVQNPQCNPIQKNDPFWQPYLTHLHQDKYSIDLPGAVTAQLLNAGIESESIIACELCTSCHNKDFYSCYKEGYLSGRFATLIGLQI